MIPILGNIILVGSIQSDPRKQEFSKKKKKQLKQKKIQNKFNSQKNRQTALDDLKMRIPDKIHIIQTKMLQRAMGNNNGVEK